MACSMIRLDGVTKRFGDIVAVDERLALRRSRRGGGAARPVGLREDDAAPARSRGSSARTRARSRSPERRSRGRALGAARGAARRHGLPGLRALPAPHGRRERRLRPPAPRRAPRRVRSCSRSSASTASAAATRTSSPAASSSASRSRGRSRRRPSSSCSTSRGRTSTRSCARRCARRWRRSSARSASPSSSSRTTARRRSRSPTASRSCATARSSRRERRRSSTSLPRRAGRPSSSAPATSSPGRVVDGRVETRVGAFPANGASAHEAGATCSCDPSCSSSSPTPPGAAEVVAREFRGHDVFYRVLLDGVELVSHGRRPRSSRSARACRSALHEGRVPVLD